MRTVSIALRRTSGRASMAETRPRGRQPAQRNSREAVAVLHCFRAGAHDIQDYAGLISPEILQHRLQRGVVADIPQTQRPNTPTRGRSRASRARPRRGVASGSWHLLFRPGTTALSDHIVSSPIVHRGDSDAGDGAAGSSPQGSCGRMTLIHAEIMWHPEIAPVPSGDPPFALILARYAVGTRCITALSPALICKCTTFRASRPRWGSR